MKTKTQNQDSEWEKTTLQEVQDYEIKSFICQDKEGNYHSVIIDNLKLSSNRKELVF